MRTDGCSFWGPLKYFKSAFGGDRYYEYCKEHDFLRRYAVIHWFKADLLLAKRLWNHNLLGKIRMPFYLTFVLMTGIVVTFRIKFGKFKRRPLPLEWDEYGIYYKERYG